MVSKRSSGPYGQRLAFVSTHTHEFITPYQIWLPQPLASTEQLVARCSTDNEVLRKVDAPNAVKAANEWLSRRLVDSRNHRADKVGAESLLVQRRRHEVGHGLGGDVALLAQAVHVDFVAEQVRDGVDIGGEACQSEEDVAVLEDLGEVVGHGEGLHAETQVAGDGDTVLAHHGHGGTTVYSCVRRKPRGGGGRTLYLLRKAKTVAVSYTPGTVPEAEELTMAVFRTGRDASSTS
jgi:hypothetical protein